VVLCCASGTAVSTPSPQPARVQHSRRVGGSAAWPPLPQAASANQALTGFATVKNMARMFSVGSVRFSQRLPGSARPGRCVAGHPYQAGQGGAWNRRVLPTN
jgi:hypothetical protein